MLGTMRLTMAKRKAAEEISSSSEDDETGTPIDAGVMRSPRVEAQRRKEQKARKQAKEAKRAAKAAAQQQMEKEKGALARAGRRASREMQGAVA